MDVGSAPPTLDVAGHGEETAEAARVAAVARYEILDTPPEEAFDRVARMAARLLNAPSALVSIVTDDRVWFKATHGLPGVSWIGRDPDPGLCSTAIRYDEPSVVPDTRNDPTTAEHPLVRGTPEARFYAAAPITTAEGYRLGAVAVLDTRPREIDENERATLRDLAAVVMDQLERRRASSQERRRRRELHAQVQEYASTLQRTLLPPNLPEVPGLQLGCHYYAADSSAVTGDFYDVFALGDGRWAFFLGDVAGHGPAAARVTSLARYTLRTAALHQRDPAGVLADLNTVLLMEPHLRRTCTVLFGILEPISGEGYAITLAGGGHPPALWRQPEQHEPARVRPIRPEGGMLLGAFADARFTTTRLTLRPGHTLLLYTDGITEARPGGEFFGEDRLAAFLADEPHTTADELITRLRGLIEGFDPPATDDIALLSLRVPTTAELPPQTSD